MAQPPLRRDRHSVSRLVVHLVFVVKDRIKALIGAALHRMQEVCLGVAEKMGFQLMELTGEADNFAGGGGQPAAVRIPADDLGLDAGKPPQGRQQLDVLRKEFPELTARGAHLWTPNYFAASAGGAPIERLREYVEAQEKPS